MFGGKAWKPSLISKKTGKFKKFEKKNYGTFDASDGDERVCFQE